MKTSAAELASIEKDHEPRDVENAYVNDGCVCLLIRANQATSFQMEHSVKQKVKDTVRRHAKYQNIIACTLLSDKYGINPYPNPKAHIATLVDFLGQSSHKSSQSTLNSRPNLSY